MIRFGRMAACGLPLLVTLLVSMPASAAFKQCPQFFIDGAVPIVSKASPGRHREICFDAFAVLHSGQSKTPVYVVERLSRKQLLEADGEKRRNRFYEEARLPIADRARLADYRAQLIQNDTAVRFDRGHMAPAADMPTAQAMAQSFSLSNMVPQASRNNRGAWASSVEKATRKYVMRASGTVYVFTGPVYVAPVQTIGANQVWVPSYLYKLVYDASTKQAWAHWMENTDSARAGKPIAYAELVRRTGIEFLPDLANRAAARPARVEAAAALVIDE